MLGNELQQFLEQPFVSTMLGMLCFLSLLLVAVVVLLVYVRRQKAARLGLASASTEGFSMSNHDDMPDMNLLVSAPAQPEAKVAAPVIPVSQPVAPVTPAPQPATPARPVRKGTFQITPRDGVSTEAVEVLTILRDVTDGSLLIQMGDKVYQNVNIDSEFRDRFNKLMGELGQIVKQTTPPAASNPAPQTAVEQPAEIPQPAPSVAAAPKASRPASPPPVTANGVVPGVLPSFKLDDQPMGQKRGRKLELPPVPEINIAGAIESYLQHKLWQSGDLPGRSVHIYPSPGGGVRIEVDGQFYEAVGDITDANVREYLAQTIQEWQEHH